jgi:LPXTG-motif cell wall-anchored protein
VGDYLLNERNGVPEFEMSAGEYQLVARFTDTPVRKVGNWVTVVGLVGLGGWGLWLKKRIRS